MTRPPRLNRLQSALLRAVRTLGDDAYGVPVRREAEKALGRWISVGALYVTMDRLEQEGYVRSFSVERGGRARCYWQPVFDYERDLLP